MSGRSVNNSIQIPVPLVFPIREIRGNLMRVIEIHHKYGAKDNIIVENLWKLHQYQASGHVDYVPNSHPVFKADKQGADIASGMTDDQKMYQACFRELYKEKPTAIINQLFFYDKADDTSYETHVAVKEFLSSAEGAKLIVNPTPDTVRFISNLNQDELTVSVADEALAGLYSHEMPNVHFVPFKSIGLCMYDSVLLIIRNEAEYPNWTGYSALNYISEKALVMISAPEAIIKVRSRDNNFSSQNDTDAGFVTLRNRLSINGLHVEKILLIPNLLTQSHPKSKRLIVCRKGTTQLHPVRIYNSFYRKNNLTIPLFAAEIPEDLVWSPDQSIKDAYDHQVKKEKATSTNSYSDKQYYDYSSEIRFRFTMNAGKRNYRVRATLLGHKTKHSLINPPIEKGLASSSSEEAQRKIEQVLVYRNDQVREIILSDLFQNTPLELIRQYSIKTLWYIHRPAFL